MYKLIVERIFHNGEHLIGMNGYNIVVDVNSGAIHTVYNVVYDIIFPFTKRAIKQFVRS